MNLLLVDIDHTLTHAHWRDNMIAEAHANKEWDAYHEASAKDEPVKEMIELVQTLWACDWTIVAFTTRPNKFRKLTLDWLCQNGVTIDYLLMRSDDDFRPSPESKVATYQEYISKLRQKPTNVLIIDDHDGVVSAFKDINITMLQAHVRRHP